MSDQPVDLMELLNTGRSGPTGFGMRREAVRSLIDAEDIKVDSRSGGNETAPWCIYGLGCEFFFDADHLLRHIKLIPRRPQISTGGSSVWNGQFHLDVGRHPVNFAGTTPGAIENLPKALKTLHEREIIGRVGVDPISDAITITLQKDMIEMTLAYSVEALQILVADGQAFRVDYLLSAVWIIDNGHPPA